jgi:acyl-CoA thioester hydrolase
MTPIPLAARRAPFRYCQPIAVRFSDFDAMGHVNNAVYLTYCEIARLGYWAAVSRDLPLADQGFILARIELDYRRPIQWGHAVRVCTRAIAVGRKSFTQDYRIIGTADGADYLAAEGRSVLVAYDYAAGRSAPLPPAARAALEAYEGYALEPK